MKLKTLANVLIEPLAIANTADASSTAALFVHSNKEMQKEESGYTLVAGSTHDFCTYFNMLSLAKWKQYTEITDFFLRLSIEGTYIISFFEVNASGMPSKIAQQHIDSSTGTITFRIPQSDAALLGFSVTAQSDCILTSAAYCADVEHIAIHDVRLNIVMTTFNNERYIVPNIELFTSLFEDEDELGSNLDVFIIDNGRSLSADIVPPSAQAHIHVFPNDNAGGAGGFCRGMMEAQKSEFNPTHILLMDDDVSISPESFRRTFTLLQLRKDAYRNACINGAMLRLEKPTWLTEDVAAVHFAGSYDSIKAPCDLADLSNVVAAETTNVEVPHAYGAWWYCCMPCELIREKGLPLPVFVRCDDVEFGLRLSTTYMTLAGICVWHAGFEGRFKGSSDLYQYIRNFMIVNAMHDVFSEQVFLTRVKRRFAFEMSSFSYNNAELILDALEDYIAGPTFLQQADGSAIMKENSAKNERFKSRTEIENELGLKLSALFHPRDVEPDDKKIAGGKVISHLVMPKRFDPHKLKASELRSTPILLNYDNTSVLDAFTQKASTIVAYNPEQDQAAIRYLDRRRYAALEARKKKVFDTLRTSGSEIRKMWHDAFPYLTSEAFWRSYLHLD